MENDAMVKCPQCGQVNYVAKGEKFMLCDRCDTKIIAAFLRRFPNEDTTIDCCRTVALVH